MQIGSHAFTYDYVYGNKGSPSSSIFDDCVAPLVEALFYGYNATVLAYGQVPHFAFSSSLFSSISPILIQSVVCFELSD